MIIYKSCINISPNNKNIISEKSSHNFELDLRDVIACINVFECLKADSYQGCKIYNLAEY